MSKNKLVILVILSIVFVASWFLLKNTPTLSLIQTTSSPSNSAQTYTINQDQLEIILSELSYSVDSITLEKLSQPIEKESTQTIIYKDGSKTITTSTFLLHDDQSITWQVYIAPDYLSVVPNKPSISEARMKRLTELESIFLQHFIKQAPISDEEESEFLAHFSRERLRSIDLISYQE